ncbi:hypothetical protein [Falsiroseomonas selenitidurans]|uniref:Uncharacterized protein n=1 Tax=Falsiroseomonas selenitidurans TaxID=2716335 RepID=A0ABX1EH51_9PROT|nr:hypothetical protein [Falsiroseomonas selenitidurans]NKC34180.1 hypothetical protein [Falsiroseomonas selenitidurans]
MIFADDAALAEHVQALLEARLPKPRWTHAGHLAATAGLLLLHPGLDAAQALPGLIRRLNDSHGVPNSDTRGYHATITLYFLAAIRAELAEAVAPQPAHARVNTLLAGPLAAGKAVMAPHWSEARLFSVAARRGWVPPDRAPLPYAISG